MDSPNLTQQLNGTKAPPLFRFEEPFSVRVVKSAALALVFVFSLAGNSLILGSVIRNINKRMRTVSNLFIVNMSVAYLLVTLVNIPGLITNINLLHGFVAEGALGAIFCALRNSVPVLTVSLSTQSFALLSIDRFIAVYFPIRRIPQRTAYILISVTWITSFAFCFIYAYGSVVWRETDGTLVCVVHVVKAFGSLRGLVIFVWIEFTVFTIAPLALASILYSATIMKLWRGRPSSCHRLPAAQSYSEKANKNAVKMLVIVMIAFAVSWIPLWIFTIVCRGTVKHFLQHRLCSNLEFAFLRYFLAYSNCAIVSFLYPIFSQNFRSGFKDILSLMFVRFCCKRGPEQGSVKPTIGRYSNPSTTHILGDRRETKL